MPTASTPTTPTRERPIGTGRARRLLSWAIERPLGVLAAGIAVSVAGCFAMAMISGFMTDDGYYYALLARNIAAGRGWTFDGATTTNGAHPLLLGLETAVAALGGPHLSNILYYRALALALALVPIAFAVWLPRALGHALPDERQGAFPLAMALAIGALFLPAYQQLWWSGMESTLALPLGAAFVILWAQRRDVAAGFVGGALVMSRLDTIVFFVLPLVAVRVLADLRGGASWPRIVGSGVRLLWPTLTLVAAYSVFDLAKFGEVVPIHGALKSSFPRLHIQLFQLFGAPAPLVSMLGWLQVQGHYIFLAAVMAFILFRRRMDPVSRLTAVALLLVYVLSQANYVLFQKWSKAVPTWYLWQPLLAAWSALALALVPMVSDRVARAAAVGLGLILPLTALSAVRILRFISFATFVRRPRSGTTRTWTTCAPSPPTSCGLRPIAGSRASGAAAGW